MVPMEGILASLEHTLLKVDASVTLADLDAGASLVAEKGLRGFVVPPQLVKTTAGRHPEVKVITVVGFPLGFETFEVKELACRQAAEDGAAEVDAVLDLSALVNGDFARLRRELELLVDVAERAGLGLKVIIETPILTERRIIRICGLISEFDLLAAKTSTGYAREPIRAEHVRLMRRSLREGIRVKASGGIRSLAEVRGFLAAGASFIGTSSTRDIIQQLESESPPPDADGGAK